MHSPPKPSIDMSSLKIEKYISKGAQGNVNVARSSKCLSIFALKVYFEKQRTSLRKEVEALTNLEHQHIVRMRGCNENSILLDYHSNGTLFDLVEKKRFSERVAKFYFLELLSAMKYMHDKNWVHRDIKLENILISQDYHLVLADFGFAAQQNPNKLFSDHMGTKMYNAPEINLKLIYSGKKADIFAAGVVLFSLVLQEMPFRAASTTDQNFLLLNFKPQDFWDSIQNQKLDLSSNFIDLIMKMLKYDPRDRIDIDEVLRHPWLNDDSQPCTHAEAANYIRN